MRCDYYDAPLELKFSGGEVGTFTGYASVFGNVDRGLDIVEPGAFAKTLKKRGDAPLPMLWQHDASEPIGVFTALVEDEKGLKVEGQLAVPDVRRAVEAHALMKLGAVGGLSIGYRIPNAKAAVMDADGTRRIKELDLIETSLLTAGFAMNPKARVTAVKAVQDVRSLEAFLRDAGLSRSEAKALLSKGAAGLGLRDADAEESADLVSALRGLRAQIDAR